MWGPRRASARDRVVRNAEPKGSADEGLRGRSPGVVWAQKRGRQGRRADGREEAGPRKAERLRPGRQKRGRRGGAERTKGEFAITGGRPMTECAHEVVSRCPSGRRREMSAGRYCDCRGVLRLRRVVGRSRGGLRGGRVRRTTWLGEGWRRDGGLGLPEWG